jgi:2,3-bisphosphoglycerate-dependent phosphoglycerate mutase
MEQSAALAERCVGSAANMTVEQIDRVLRQDPRCTPLPSTWQRDPTYTLPFPGAESLMQAGERVARYLEERARQIAQRVQRDTVKVFVGHGGSFRHAAVHLGVLSLEEVSTLSMHHCTPVFLERIDSGRWAHVAGQWKLRQPVGAPD